jgi:hypothetical protein
MFMLLPNVQTMIDQANLTVQMAGDTGKSQLVYSSDAYEEEFYSPRREKVLVATEYRLLKQFYSRYEFENKGQTKVYLTRGINLESNICSFRFPRRLHLM